MGESEMVDGDPRLAEPVADARHARNRYELYRAKVYARKPSSPARLRELKRDCEFAEGRLSRLAGALRAAAEDDTHEQEIQAEAARVEAELRRDPNRADTKVARASDATFTLVRAVRDRLGLYSRSR